MTSWTSSGSYRQPLWSVESNKLSIFTVKNSKTFFSCQLLILGITSLLVLYNYSKRRLRLRPPLRQRSPVLIGNI